MKGFSIGVTKAYITEGTVLFLREFDTAVSRYMPMAVP
jgi:hypothetical protein